MLGLYYLLERHKRNPSDGGTLEKKGKMRDALTKFLSNRSDKKELVKKGIYKGKRAVNIEEVFMSYWIH